MFATGSQVQILGLGPLYVVEASPVGLSRSKLNLDGEVSWVDNDLLELSA